MARTKTPPRPREDWAQRTPANLVDRDAWPIRATAAVTCRRNGKRTSGIVTDTYLDHKRKPVVEVSTDFGSRLFRPEECKIQRPRGKR
jgi:hypothetical protein